MHPSSGSGALTIKNVACNDWVTKAGLALGRFQIIVLVVIESVLLNRYCSIDLVKRRLAFIHLPGTHFWNYENTLYYNLGNLSG